MISEDQLQEGTDIQKHKTKMADKENVNRPTKSKNSTMIREKNCIPLKPNELTRSAIAIDTQNCADNNQPLPFLLNKDDPEIQHMSLNQTFHLERNSKEKLTSTEKPKQDAVIPKKPVLGFYRGKVVESKINSFRKPLQVKDESSVANRKLPSSVSNAIASKPQPFNTSRVAVKSVRATSVISTTKAVSTTSQKKQLVRPPIRSHHHSSQDQVKQGIIRTSANVTIRKGPRDKALLPLKMDLCSVKTSSSADIKRNEASSRSVASGVVPRPVSSSTIKPIEKSKTIDQRRQTIAKANVTDKSSQSKGTAEQRNARLTEWRGVKGKVLKRPPSAIVHHPEPEGQNEKPFGSFWTTMAEEDEQRLFTEKVNKTFAECLNLIDEGCPREEILITLDDLIKSIPDATKLVKYWVCLVRLEPATSPIENIITIYEKAVLAMAQPIEELRHVIADILKEKSQEKVHSGDNAEACTTTEQAHEVNTEDTGINLEPEKLKVENNNRRSELLKDCDQEQEEKPKDCTNDVKTPDKETRESCLIKYNVSTTPYLQSAKKKIQCDETNAIFKELKFLTPVRRSRRLQDKTSKLPDMLKDHYPCVSSLEQLAELGGETDAFVCRPNAALCRMFSEMEITEEK
ncbi:cytoskeleton-associated protein 2-like [Rhynchocyon petersi]